MSIPFDIITQARNSVSSHIQQFHESADKPQLMPLGVGVDSANPVVQKDVLSNDGAVSTLFKVLSATEPQFTRGLPAVLPDVEQQREVVSNALQDHAMQKDLLPLISEIDKQSPKAIALAAEKLVGMREQGDNRGKIIDLIEGQPGQPWCGSFIYRIANDIMPGLYSQPDYTSARSFMREGIEHDAFHTRGSSYVPQAGDVLVMKRGDNSWSGHTAIITGYDEDTKRITYVAGNESDQVKRGSIPLSHASVLGVTSTQQLAEAKGIGKANSKEQQFQFDYITASNDAIKPMNAPVKPVRGMSPILG